MRYKPVLVTLRYPRKEKTQKSQDESYVSRPESCVEEGKEEVRVKKKKITVKRTTKCLANCK